MNSTTTKQLQEKLVLSIEDFLEPFEALCRQANVPNRQKSL
jgi:hypothetical protein